MDLLNYIFQTIQNCMPQPEDLLEEFTIPIYVKERNYSVKRQKTYSVKLRRYISDKFITSRRPPLTIQLDMCYADYEGYTFVLGETFTDTAECFILSSSPEYTKYYIRYNEDGVDIGIFFDVLNEYLNNGNDNPYDDDDGYEKCDDDDNNNKKHYFNPRGSVNVNGTFFNIEYVVIHGIKKIEIVIS